MKGNLPSPFFVGVFLARKRCIYVAEVALLVAAVCGHD